MYCNVLIKLKPILRAINNFVYQNAYANFINNYTLYIQTKNLFEKMLNRQ